MSVEWSESESCGSVTGRQSGAQSAGCVAVRRYRARVEELVAPTGLRVNMLLCDAAQANGGKLYVLGGGLSVIGPKPQPLALAIQVTVPWDRANISHQWKLDLVDEDGRQAMIGEKPVSVSGRFEAGRPAGLRAGTPLGVALAINLTALRLKAGVGYSFVFGIDGESRPEWRAQLFMKGNAAAP